MARFVIADLTDARSVLQELQAIVPGLPSVAVRLLIKKAEHEYGMLDYIRKYTDISDLERRELYRKNRDTITDRDGMAEALNLSPNRVSELTIRGQLVAANKQSLRYAVKHNIECYANYKWAIDKEFFSRLTNLPPEGENN